MIKGVLICITVLLAVSGLCDIIHTIRSWVFSSKRPRNNYSIIYLKCGDAVSQLKFVNEQYRWYGTDFAEYIIAITDDVSNEELKQLEQAFDGNEYIFCPSVALPNVLRSISSGR